ncbi:DUF1573 domain-containing protein [Myxococcota bacterium]|nr:DUF1573 domain-containing protein [Myxococcota bacterium]
MRYRPNVFRAVALAGGLLFVIAGCAQEPTKEASEAAPSETTSDAGSGSAVVTAPPPPRPDTAAMQEQIAAAQAQTRPPIRVVPSVLNWGTVAPSASVTSSVRLENISDKPLKIISVQPGCKCTTTDDLNGKTIPPNGSLELEAVLDAQPNPGPRNVQIRVLIDGYSNVLTINAKAEIARPVRARPPYINAVEGKNPVGNFMVSSIDRSPFKILSVQGEEPRYLQPRDANELKSSYIITYDIDNYVQPDGKLPRFIVVETDRADSPLVEIMLRHELAMPTLSRDFKLTDYKLNLGRVAPGGSVVHNIGVQESTTTGPLVTVIGDEGIMRTEVLEQSVDEETDELYAKVRFTVLEGTAEGFYYFPLQLFASNQSELAIPAFISVRSDPGRLPGDDPISPPPATPTELPGITPADLGGSG